MAKKYFRITFCVSGLTLCLSYSKKSHLLIELNVNLDEKCRRQQLGEGWFNSFGDVPEQAISMSVKQIMKSKAIICSVPDIRKADAVKGTLEGEVSPLVPASILRQHNATWLFLDKESSSLLT